MAKKKLKFNNPYKVENEMADTIRNLGNQELISRVNQEHKNWKIQEKMKKNDPEINRASEQKNEMDKEIAEIPKVIEAKQKYEEARSEFKDEEYCRLEEELKNLRQPYQEDIQKYKGMFNVAMDELNIRLEKGYLKEKPALDPRE